MANLKAAHIMNQIGTDSGVFADFRTYLYVERARTFIEVISQKNSVRMIIEMDELNMILDDVLYEITSKIDNYLAGYDIVYPFYNDIAQALKGE